MLTLALAIKAFSHYQLNGTVYMPLANVSFPFSLYQNETSYVFDQNNGEAVHIWNSDLYYYLRTEGTTRTCYQKPAEWVEVHNYLPDLADYQLQQAREIINGTECAVYLKRGVNYASSQGATYFAYEEYEQKFYCIPLNNDECIPVYWITHGRDPATNSHRDVYIYQYNEFDFAPDYFVYGLPEMCAEQPRMLSMAPGGFIASTVEKRKQTFDSYDYPDALDLRIKGMSTPVKDQCTCGSCWAFGVAAMLEGRINKRLEKSKHPLIRVSEEQIVSCSWKDNLGCFGGNPYTTLQQMIDDHAGKIPLEKLSPYIGFEQTCDDNFFTDEYGVIEEVLVLDKSKDAVKEALKDGPISVGTAVPTSYLYYSGGVFNDPACGYGEEAQITHVVTLVGYGTDPEAGEYWIIKNSWSNAWGIDGYMYLSTENDLCGILQEPTIVKLKEPNTDSNNLFAIIFGSIIGACAVVCLGVAIWMYMRKYKVRALPEEDHLLDDRE